MEKNYRGFYCISGVLEFSKDGKLWDNELNIFSLYHHHSQPITSLELFEFSQSSDLSFAEGGLKIDVPIFLLEFEAEDFEDILGSSYYKISSHFNETRLSSYPSIQCIYDFVKETLEEGGVNIRRVWRLTP